jgi:tetratricopeptide (TPR) repeat protein
MGNKMIKMALLMAACVGSSGIAMAQQKASPAAAQSVVVSGQKNASKWFRAESQHFIVTSDTSTEDARLLLNNLEKLDYVLRAYTKNYRGDGASKQKLSLYYHDRMASFNEVATNQPPEAVGLYNSCGAGVQGFAVHLEPIVNLNNNQLTTHLLGDSLSYIFEAYARHFLYRYTDIRKPDMYVDGFAQYFASVRFSDNQMVIGRVPAGLGQYLHFLREGHRYALTYDDVFTHSTRNPGHAGAEALRLEFLSRSWLLTHYMLSSPEQFPKLDKYLDLVHHEVAASDAFNQAFGISLDDLDSVMMRYQIKGIKVMQVNMPEMPVARINFTSLPNSITDFILADAALKSCPDRKTGEALLRTVSARADGVPNNDVAKLTISRAQIDWGNPRDALPYLTEAVRKDPANADALYLLGAANLRLAEQQPDSLKADSLKSAKTLLTAARRANPGSAEAAFALYRAELGTSDKPGEAVTRNALAAWRNAHEVNTYARAAALSLAYAGRSEEADSAFTLLAHDTREPAMAAWAKNWQARLNVGVSRADLLAEMRREPVIDGGFKEWTVAGSSMMSTITLNAGLEESRAYLEGLNLGNPMEAAQKGNMPISIPPKQ